MKVRPDKRRRTGTTSANTSTEDVSTAATDGIELASVGENDEDEEDEDEDEEIVQHTQREAENRAQRERDRAAGVHPRYPHCTNSRLRTRP